MDNKLCITVEEMGKRLGISRITAYELSRSEGFPTLRLGRRVLISVKGLEGWLDRQIGGGSREAAV